MGILPLLGACTHEARPPTVSAVSVTAAELAVPSPSTPYAPAGERITVRLATPISTSRNSAGDAFSAELLTPIRASDGSVLAPAGSSLMGHIAEVAFGGAGPGLRLGFDAVETTQWRSPLAVTVLSAAARTVPGNVERTETGIVRRPSHLVLPVGARLELQLQRPLVVPRGS